MVYTDGTEDSAQAAFSYRIGMTMAEWACRGLMGLGPTAHAEAGRPSNAGWGWSPEFGLPDLIGDHPTTGIPWLIEAKGGRRLGSEPLKKGAAQLRRPALLTGPHVKMLCGASLTDQLFMMIDVDEHRGGPASTTPEDDGEQLLAHAQSRMLFYLALQALPQNSLQILPIGPGAAASSGRRGRAGTVELLETDHTTEAERARVRDDGGYRQRPGSERFDMLTGSVPGTDLLIGLSRRLYSACANLAELQLSMAREVDAEQPRPRPDAEPDEIETVQDRRRELLFQRERSQRQYAAERTGIGFVTGQRRRWEELLGRSVPLTPDPPAGFLEAATADTYLAVDVRAISTAQPSSQRP
ncbi:hypothetical protein [Dactylosporangium sp. CA-139066]|uniref:hypothetical protein n=1 Tax=Dactylosporangium sp. CA-139066 TaxID=3239930 RepID=UPI003D938008